MRGCGAEQSEGGSWEIKLQNTEQQGIFCLRLGQRELGIGKGVQTNQAPFMPL